MNIKQLLLPTVCSLLLLPLQSCDDDADKQAQAEYMKEQVAAFEGTVNRLNASILCYQSLLSGEIPVGITPIETGYKVELSGGNAYNIGAGEEVDAFFPLSQSPKRVTGLIASTAVIISTLPTHPAKR